MTGKKRSIPFIIFNLLLLSSAAESARILVSQAIGSRSHQNTFVPLIKALSERGHQITYITNFPVTDTNENVTQIILDQLDINKMMPMDQFQQIESSSLATGWKMFQISLKSPKMVAEAVYQHPQVQDLIRNAHFDLVIAVQFLPSSSYPLAWHFQTPLVLISPNVLMPGMAPILGESDHPEYVSLFGSLTSDRPTFKDRLFNVITNFFMDFFLNTYPVWMSMETIQRSLPGCPPFLEIAKNVSLVLTNSHPVFNPPRVLPLEVVEVGAIHCRPPKPLPTDLEEFVSTAEDGFIIFAVGSAIPMNEMPGEMMQSFIRAFARLPQKVIWQWKGTPKYELPDNIMTVGWLPQQDLLGHEKCRLFLTHGGLNSLQEAVYHAVPVLGLPFGNDQVSNVASAVKRGYALQLDWTGIAEEAVSGALEQLLQNPQYSEKVRQMSSLLRDQPGTPLERAVYWTEHVLRHNGTRHLRLASRDLAPYQRALIDVYAVLILSALIPLVLTIACLRKCCCKKNLAPIGKKNQ